MITQPFGSHPFPLVALPSAFETAVTAIAGSYGLPIGGVAVTVLTCYGAAVGGRVAVRLGDREHSLNLPVTLVTAPLDETTALFDELASVFQRQAELLDKFHTGSPEYLQEERRLRNMLNQQPPGVPLTVKEIAAANTRLMELEALRAHRFLAVDHPSGVDEIFDGHQLLYGRSKRIYAEYLGGGKADQARIATVLRKGFFGADETRLAALIQATPVLAMQTVSAWRAGSPSWPMLFVNNAGTCRTSLNVAGAAAGLNLVKTGIDWQLDLRVTHEPVVIGLGEAALPAINALTAEIAGLSGEIDLPEAYSHFVGVLVRLAGILDLMDGNEGAGKPITSTSWGRAGRIASWLLAEQHAFVRSTVPEPKGEPVAAGSGVRRKKYPSPTARDAHFFMANLARLQPTGWRRLRQRLPKRHPGYWQAMREQLILVGNVDETAGVLSVKAALAA